MSNLKKLKRIKMNWLTVIIFAVITGVYTGLIMLVPALKDTSFQDIGIRYEWWVIFAVIIVVNCKKNWEAMLKCFVFFLISQPIVYAVEVLFGKLLMNNALYYYKYFWLPITLLTLPGGFLAYYCKKQNIFGSIVMGLGNTIQMVMGISYVIMAAASFPHHLLSAIVCFASIVIMTILIQKQKKHRIIAFAVAIVMSGLLVALVKATGRFIVSGVF